MSFIAAARLCWMMGNICLLLHGWIQAVRFFLSPAKMNGHVFIHSGVKLLLYLADRHGLMYSLRSFFYPFCTLLARVSGPYHTCCGGFTEALFSDNKRFVSVLGRRNVLKCTNAGPNRSDGSAQTALTPRWLRWLIDWSSKCWQDWSFPPQSGW